jgi:SAM-dependent methyltransferase
VEGTLTDPRFPEETLDVVYLTNTYRHLDKPLEVLRNIAPSLRPSGKLAIIDIKRYRGSAEEKERGGSNEIIRIAEQAGYELIKLETSMPRDDIYVFELNSRIEASPGSYLGQKPPGMTPALFAPGIVTTDMGEGCSGWGNKREYFIFQRWNNNRIPKLYLMNQTNGVWSDPEPVPFLDKYQAGDFTIAPDGKTIVFASNLFIEEIGTEGEGGNIWTVEKTETGWTEAKHIGLQINTKYHDSYPCLTENGSLYFFSRRPGGYGDSDLYVSEFIGGEYQAPVNLGPKLNTKYHEWDTYAAPDESYMIYCSTKPSGLGEDDLYVTFKTPEGSWCEPIHMGKGINTNKSENRPYVSPDGKYFFYTSTIRGNRDIFWVDAKIIDGLKPHELRE